MPSSGRIQAVLDTDPRGRLGQTRAAARRATGAMSQARGIAAEEQVIARYVAQGARLLHQRWRGRAGEIDLIFDLGDEVVFVEVKSSRTHDTALALLGHRQIQRLCRAMEEFLGDCEKGTLTPMRFEVALRDQTGEIQIFTNALQSL